MIAAASASPSWSTTLGSIAFAQILHRRLRLPAFLLSFLSVEITLTMCNYFVLTCATYEHAGRLIIHIVAFCFHGAYVATATSFSSAMLRFSLPKRPSISRNTYSVCCASVATMARRSPSRVRSKSPYHTLPSSSV